jgi:hypothetical protein
MGMPGRLRAYRRPAIALAVVTAAIGVSLFPAAPAPAATQYPTVFTKFKYKLEDGKATFKGTIDSPKGGCVKDRKTVLYRQHNGNTDKVGGDHTNNKGKFEIDLGNAAPGNGKYHAKVKQSKLGDNTCLARTSGSVKVSSG